MHAPYDPELPHLPKSSNTAVARASLGCGRGRGRGRGGGVGAGTKRQPNKQGNNQQKQQKRRKTEELEQLPPASTAPAAIGTELRSTRTRMPSKRVRENMTLISSDDKSADSGARETQDLYKEEEEVEDYFGDDSGDEGGTIHVAVD